MNTPRILVIMQNLPYPAFSGRDLRNWQNINGLMDLGQVGVFGLCSDGAFRAKPPDGRLAFWQPSSDPNLSYPSGTPSRLETRPWLLDPLGHPSDVYDSDIVTDELKRLLTEFKPEIALLEGLWMHRHIDLLKSHPCRVILDCHGVEASLSREIAALTCGDDLRAKLSRKILPERTKLIEQKATHAVHQIWVCSRDDARLMEALYRPPVPIHIVPNGLDLGYYYNGAGADQCPLLTTRRSIVFPGMFGYQPNRVAAAFLIEEIFPKLANTFDDCQLIFPGSWPTAHMLDAAKRDPRILVTGAVPDIRPYLSSAFAMVVPLFQGSGTRFKILEAWAAKVPVVSTAKGAEGLDVENERHLLFAETASEFLQCLRRLWTNKPLAEKLTVNGLELVKRDYSWRATSRRISLAVNELQISKPDGASYPL
jgi:glycosyltransferase involved in cell wall biosynthesis